MEPMKGKPPMRMDVTPPRQRLRTSWKWNPYNKTTEGKMHKRAYKWVKAFLNDGTTWGAGALAAVLLGTDAGTGTELVDAVLTLLALVRGIYVAKESRPPPEEG